MPSSPPAVFSPPSGSTPGAPAAVFTPAAGGSPGSPAAVFTAPGGGSPSSPAAIFTAPGGGSPSSPAAVFSAPGGGSPSAPDAVFVPAAAGAGQSFEFEDSENPERDGTYVYLGLYESEIPVWARDDAELSIEDDVLTGAGFYFMQPDGGSGYVWELAEATDLPGTSPTVWVTQSEPSEDRDEFPTPPDYTGWDETLSFSAVSGLASPAAVFTPASGGSPSSPAAVFTPISGGGGPTPPPRIFGLSADMVLSESGDEILTESSTNYISTEAS